MNISYYTYDGKQGPYSESDMIQIYLSSQISSDTIFINSSGKLATIEQIYRLIIKRFQDADNRAINIIAIPPSVLFLTIAIAIFSSSGGSLTEGLPLIIFLFGTSCSIFIQIILMVRDSIKLNLPSNLMIISVLNALVLPCFISTIIHMAIRSGEPYIKNRIITSILYNILLAIFILFCFICFSAFFAWK